MRLTALVISVILWSFRDPIAASKKKPDVRALRRLDWMRRQQGDLWAVIPKTGAFLRRLAEKVRAKRALGLGYGSLQ